MVGGLQIAVLVLAGEGWHFVDAIAGTLGLLLFLIAVDMLFEKRTERREKRAEEEIPDPSVFPLALPDIVNSLRLLFGLGFGYLILAEVISTEYGLGKIIDTSRRIGPREHVYLCLIIIALLSYSIDRLIFWCQKRWFPYRQEH